MKWWQLVSQVIGFVSSLLLAWGYKSPPGQMIIVDNKPLFEKLLGMRLWGVRIGFLALAISFFIQAVVTIISENP